MKLTTKHNLNKPDYTDKIDIEKLNENFEKIDNGLSKFYVATQSSTNVYKVTTGLNKTSLENGYSIRVAIPSASTGAVSLIVDNVTVAVKKPDGSAVTNFKQNGVYALTYYNSVFILASGGVDTVNFSASDLLTGKSANNSNGEKVSGTMTNQGAKTATLNCGGSYTIPKGYHNGSGKVTANSLASHLSSDTLELASQLLAGVKAHTKNGVQVTGTATIQSLGGSILKSGENETPLQLENSNKKYLDLSSLGTPKIVVGIYDDDRYFAYYNGIVSGFTSFIYCRGSSYSTGDIQTRAGVGTNTQFPIIYDGSGSGTVNWIAVI